MVARRQRAARPEGERFARLPGEPVLRAAPQALQQEPPQGAHRHPRVLNQLSEGPPARRGVTQDTAAVAAGDHGDASRDTGLRHPGGGDRSSTRSRRTSSNLEQLLREHRRVLRPAAGVRAFRRRAASVYVPGVNGHRRVGGRRARVLVVRDHRPGLRVLGYSRRLPRGRSCGSASLSEVSAAVRSNTNGQQNHHRYYADVAPAVREPARVDRLRHGVA